jgi:hypothetical protein
VSQDWSTYIEFKMDDAKSVRYNHPWEIGTLRHAQADGKWAVSPWTDRWWGTARGAWNETGEYFDGEAWRPLKNVPSTVSLRHHLEQLRNKR